MYSTSHNKSIPKQLYKERRLAFQILIFIHKAIVVSEEAKASFYRHHFSRGEAFRVSLCCLVNRRLWSGRPTTEREGQMKPAHKH